MQARSTRAPSRSHRLRQAGVSGVAAGCAIAVADRHRCLAEQRAVPDRDLGAVTYAQQRLFHRQPAHRATLELIIVQQSRIGVAAHYGDQLRGEVQASWMPVLAPNPPVGG